MATWFLVAAPADCACFQVGPFSDVDHTNGDVTAGYVRGRRQVWCCSVKNRKKTPGGAGTLGRTRAHGSHRRTSQPSKPTNTSARPHTARRPNPRPTQQPQPRSRTGTSPFSAERNRADPSLVLQHVSLTSPFLHDAPSPTRCPTRRPGPCGLYIGIVAFL